MSASEFLSVEQFGNVFQIVKEFPNFEPSESFQSSGLDNEIGNEIYVAVRLIRAYLKGLSDAGFAPEGVVFDILDYQHRFDPLSIEQGKVQACLTPRVAVALVPFLREISRWLERLDDTFTRTGFTSTECTKVIDLLVSLSP